MVIWTLTRDEIVDQENTNCVLKMHQAMTTSNTIRTLKD